MDHLNDVVKKIAEDPSKAWEIAKTVAQVSTKVFNFRKTLKTSEEKHQVDEILDTLSELKHSAGELEDENRALRGKLRFKSDDYVFKNPFRYHKDRPDVALCVKCFAANIEAPMGEQGFGCAKEYRLCLVCGNIVKASKGHDSGPPILLGDFPRSF